MKWLLAAAAVVLIAGLSVWIGRNGGNHVGPKATVEDAGSPSLYRVGEMIEAGNAIRSNSAVGLLLALEDDSRIEMRSQSELKLESADDGIRVRLNSGSIRVTAVKQGAGHLYVQTRDALVSVVGTVFFVNAEQSGTTVSVVEGEVHVQQGAELKKLLPGDQVATDSARAMKPISEEIAWSRSAATYVAMLQQPAGAVPATPPIEAKSIPSQDSAAVTSQQVTPEAVPLSSNPLPFKVQANYVRVSSEQVRTLITIQFTNRDLAFQDEGVGKKAKAHIQGEIYRIDNRRLPGLSEDIALEFPSNTFAANLDKSTLYQESRYLAPGKYKIQITVEDTNSHNVGVQDYALNVPLIPDQTLAASSMILASSIADLPPRVVGTDMFALGDKQVRPNPGGVFGGDESLNVWQEVYGLTTDPATRKTAATFELVISHDNQEVRKLTSNVSELLSSGKLTYINSVPLGNFAAGSYDVQLRVTDSLANARMVTVGKFAVSRVQELPLAGSNVLDLLAVLGRTPQAAPNPGRNTFYRACSTCHVAELAGLRNYSTKAEFANLVSRQQSMGAMVSNEELQPLIDYLFETYGKKADPSVPQDIPVQRQK
jgi:hypothetical protein